MTIADDNFSPITITPNLLRLSESGSSTGPTETETPATSTDMISDAVPSNLMPFIRLLIKAARLKEIFMEGRKFGLSFACTVKESLKHMLFALFAKKT